MLTVKNRIRAKDGILTMRLPDEFKDKIVDVVITVESEIAKKLLVDTNELPRSRADEVSSRKILLIFMTQ